MSSRPNTPALCHSPTINYLQSLSIKYLDPSHIMHELRNLYIGRTSYASAGRFRCRLWPPERINLRTAVNLNSAIELTTKNAQVSRTGSYEWTAAVFHCPGG